MYQKKRQKVERVCLKHARKTPMLYRYSAGVMPVQRKYPVWAKWITFGLENLGVGWITKH